MSESRTFAVVLEPEEEGGFTVRVPSLPEIVTYGKDEREALTMRKTRSGWCWRIARHAESGFLQTSRHGCVR